MSRLKLNITELILQITALLMLFIPGMYYREVWASRGYGMWTLQWRTEASFVNAANHQELFFCIIVGLMLINMALSLAEIKDINRKFNIFVSLILPVLTAIALFIFNAVVEPVNELYDTSYSVNWLFYGELAMLAAVFVTALLKCSNRVTKNQDAEVQA